MSDPVSFDDLAAKALQKITGETLVAPAPKVIPKRFHVSKPEASELELRYAADLVRRASEVTALALERAVRILNRDQPHALMCVRLCNLYDPLIERLGARAHTYINGEDIGVYRRVGAPDIVRDIGALGREIEAHQMQWKLSPQMATVLITRERGASQGLGEPNILGLHRAFINALILDYEWRK